MNTPGLLDLFADAERLMMNRLKLLAIIPTLLVLYLTGCAKNQQAVDKVSDSNANALSAQHSRFEKSDDPPFSVQTQFAAGQLAESQEAPLAAIGYYQAALKIAPHHRDSLYRTGVCYTKLKNWSRAIDAWKQYLKETGGDATAYGNLGFCYALAGRKADAEHAYQLGVARDPANVACRVNFGLFLAREERTEEATAQWKAVLTEAQVHYNLGSMYEQQNKRDQARAEFRQALQLDANLVDAKTRLAALD
jgi:tetratricopeptide (TPR) repeat protein